MKKILFFALFILSIMNVAAQNKMSYQGEVGIGYGFGMGDESINRLYVETIHGIRFNSHLFAGLGVGLASFDDENATIPLFVDVKGYLTKGLIKPYLFANLGYGLGDKSGFYGAGGFGIDVNISQKCGLYLNLGYQSQGLRNNVDDSGFYGPSNVGAFLLQLGCRF